MTAKLYVGNLPFSTSESALKDLFLTAGAVQSVKIITNPVDGRSKGFGFIEMSSQQAAQAAIDKLSGKELDGRPLVIDKAHTKEERKKRKVRTHRPVQQANCL